MAFLVFVVVVAALVVLVLRSLGGSSRRPSRRRRGTDTDPPVDDRDVLWYLPWTWGGGEPERDTDGWSAGDGDGGFD